MVLLEFVTAAGITLGMDELYKGTELEFCRYPSHWRPLEHASRGPYSIVSPKC